jgi:tetratricopeptide (TPR) repeat protein
MTIQSAKSIEVFLSYSSEDNNLCRKLKEQLCSLEQQGLISAWHDGLLQAGQERNRELKRHLQAAHVILLLISPSYMASDYCYKIEMSQAMQRHLAGEARVIPVILRSVHWQDAPFSNLQVLPLGGKPVRNWSNIDDAFFNVAKHLKIIAREFLIKRLLTEAEAFYKNRQYREAEAVWEQLLRLEINDAHAYYERGNLLLENKMYEEALAAYQEAYRCNSAVADTYFYQQKGDALRFLHRYEEAYDAYKQAIHLGQPEPDPRLYHHKGVVLECLAQEAFKEAVRQDQGASHGKLFD